MDTIAPENIQKVWEQINEASDQEIRTMAEKMQKEQPFLMLYLLATDDEEEGEEQGHLLELGARVWQVMSVGRAPLPMVTEDEIDEAEEANLKLLEGMEDASEMEFLNSGNKLFAEYNQMPLLGAVLEVLMAEYEDEPEEAPDNVGLSFLRLKTVIDCLDR